MHRYIIILALLLCSLSLWAQAEALLPSSEVAADSLNELRQTEILEDYGIRESSTLKEVAEILEVEDLGEFKQLLGFEARNTALDNRSLRQLSITPYEAFLASQTHLYGFSELDRLADVASRFNIPIKKLKNMLGEPLDPLSRDDDRRSLQALGITPERFMEIKEEFEADRIPYGLSLTLVGMLVVFSALFITSFVISLLIHMNSTKKKPTPEIKISASGKVTKTPPNTNQDIILAAITALHIYEHNIRERRKLQLTFNRSKTNQWRSSAALRMPNREYSQKRS